MSLQFKTLAKAQRDIAKWVHASHVPSFAEYMEVGMVEHAAYAGMAFFFTCLGKMATEEAYEWLKSRPKLVQTIAFKLRLVNDIYGFEVKYGYFISLDLGYVYLTKLYKKID